MTIVSARRGAGERGDPRARALVALVGLGGERVGAAVDVRVVPREVRLHRLDHDARLLRGRGAVEVHETLPAQDRELVGERGVGEGGHAGQAAAPATSSLIQP